MTESRWITEALVQFSASPIWLTPIDNFVDDNCCIFSNESEMQLEYTVVHNKFKKLIDSLLTCFLMELGVSMETAVEALQSSLVVSAQTSEGRSEQQAAKKLLKQIFNADNFSRFHTMMVKRNLELDILANAALSSDKVCGDGGAALSAEEVEKETPAPARVQRAIDLNGDVNEDDALRRAIEVSLQDDHAQQQVQAYKKACIQEDADLQMAAVEHQANREKAQLEAALQTQPAQKLSDGEHCRQNHVESINKQKKSQLQPIHDLAMPGTGQKGCEEAEPQKADFNSPESPFPLPAQQVAAAPASVAAAESAPVAAPVSVPALPSIGQRQAALPAIPSTVTASRAQYMREQREKLLARNRASRQEQLSTFLQNNSSSTATSSSAALAATGAAQSVTVEIARRLRGSIALRVVVISAPIGMLEISSARKTKLYDVTGSTKNLRVAESFCIITIAFMAHGLIMYIVAIIEACTGATCLIATFAMVLGSIPWGAIAGELVTSCSLLDTVWAIQVCAIACAFSSL
ncbi:The ARF-like 2 binding protein BART family protein [Leishmania donovani]|uniref:Cilia- and flagella-associated protein 36 n=1 Tax=Leishmania donovani TaxID=5661 RepID=A0A504XT22_LEIDO|nr:The ARF-like 2 binding protein BART family protein [Leishmania donovani]